MNEDTLQHTRLDGIVDYVAALDTLCKLARHDLYIFEKNYDGLGFNSEARYTTLRNFLLANPSHRLFVLAHDTHYLSTLCPRMIMLLRQFGTSMFIHQTHQGFWVNIRDIMICLYLLSIIDLQGRNPAVFMKDPGHLCPV